MNRKRATALNQQCSHSFHENLQEPQYLHIRSAHIHLKTSSCISFVYSQQSVFKKKCPPHKPVCVCVWSCCIKVGNWYFTYEVTFPQCVRYNHHITHIKHPVSDTYLWSIPQIRIHIKTHSHTHLTLCSATFCEYMYVCVCVRVIQTVRTRNASSPLSCAIDISDYSSSRARAFACTSYTDSVPGVSSLYICIWCSFAQLSTTRPLSRPFRQFTFHINPRACAILVRVSEWASHARACRITYRERHTIKVPVATQRFVCKLKAAACAHRAASPPVFLCDVPICGASTPAPSFRICAERDFKPIAPARRVKFNLYRARSRRVLVLFRQKHTHTHKFNNGSAVFCLCECSFLLGGVLFHAFFFIILFCLWRGVGYLCVSYCLKLCIIATTRAHIKGGV